MVFVLKHALDPIGFDVVLIVRVYINLNYCIDNIVINQVEHAKYLGVTIDSKLKWHEHINSVVKKGNSVYGFLKRNLRNCPAAVKSYCYQTYL